MFPLILGLVGAGIQAATEAGKAVAASNAPKPITPEEIKGIYDEEQQRATKGAYSQSMHALQSIAGSGGSAGSQASARRAAMLQSPAAMSDATMAGFGAGTQSAASRVGDMQGARGRQRDTALEIADQWGRVGHSAGILANDVKSGLVANEALSYERQRDQHDMDMRRELMDRLYPKPPGRRRAARRNPTSTSDYRGKLPDGYGTGGGGPVDPLEPPPGEYSDEFSSLLRDSDVRSKTRIKELETMNASLQSQLAAAGGGAASAGRNNAAAAGTFDLAGNLIGSDGLPVDPNEAPAVDDGPVVPPPSDDPRYDTYVAPKVRQGKPEPEVVEFDADEYAAKQAEKQRLDPMPPKKIRKGTPKQVGNFWQLLQTQGRY